MINGANTGRIGVRKIQARSEKATIWTTDIERTLIDATVRPVYAGGVEEVARAFENAKGHVSVKKVVSYISHINYTYPYHQCIGFYMERAGYSEAQLNLLKQFGMDYDSYLDYNIKDKEYDKTWRIRFPRGL